MHFDCSIRVFDSSNIEGIDYNCYSSLHNVPLCVDKENKYSSTCIHDLYMYICMSACKTLLLYCDVNTP